MTIDSPKKFVNLHGHSNASAGDAIGLASEHIDFAVGNGSDALAITDHGNMNQFAAMWFHSQGLKKKGLGFRPIYGMEGYFVESLDDWRRLYHDDRERKAAETAAKKVAVVKGKAKAILVGDPAAPTQLDLIEDQAVTEASTETKGEGEESALVENESESKAGRWKNPLMKRSHLVLLAKNNQGLQDLFALISESFVDGFYRYPRIDYNLLKKHCKGNIIGLQACVGGYLAGKVFDFQENPDFNTWEPTQDRFEEIQAVLATDLEKFQDCFGKENYYLELQANKLGAQHLVNQHFMELSKRSGCPLVMTVDSHYANPAHWREREIYRMMARQQIFKQEVSQMDLPKSVDDLKCELYPKNADQVWESYQRYSQPYPGLYDDVVVKEAIERTWDIAHHQIDTITLDTKPKLPRLSKIASNLTTEQDVSPGDDPEDITAFRILLKQALSGLIDFRKLGNRPEYVTRLRHELEVIKHLKLSRYFLTYSKIQEIVSQEMLLGAGRGSAAGSLLCFVLNITQVDPIKYGLLFERFLTRTKLGMPDIDCLLSNTLVRLESGDFLPIKDLVVGQRIHDALGKVQKVLFTQTRHSTPSDAMTCVFLNVQGTFGSLVMTAKHRLLLESGDQVMVSDLTPGVVLLSPSGVTTVVGLVPVVEECEVTDITVTDSKTFLVVPFNVGIYETPGNKSLVSVYTYGVDADYKDSQSNGYRSVLRL